MIKKFVFLLLISLSLLLVGCNGDNSETAVQYLQALNDRDLETAQTLVCDARQDDVTMGLVTVDDSETEGFNFESISCQPSGSDVLCRYTIDQHTENVEQTGVESNHEVVFDFEGDKVCGFDEEID
jgi:hypothetical protein